MAIVFSWWVAWGLVFNLVDATEATEEYAVTVPAIRYREHTDLWLGVECLSQTMKPLQEPLARTFQAELELCVVGLVCLIIIT